MCPAGRFSDEFEDGVGTTRRCVACAAGSYQKLSGETACIPCEAGTMAAAGGSTECESCGLGSFANSTGMSHCVVCSDDPARWTTSERMNTLTGETYWLLAGNNGM